MKYLVGLIFDAALVPGCFFLEVLDWMGCPLYLDDQYDDDGNLIAESRVLPVIIAILFASIGGWGLAVASVFYYHWGLFIIWCLFIVLLLWRASWCRKNGDL